MHFAIIAAGEGSRLHREGVTLPKPLIRIAGVPMIERLIRMFAHLGAESISVICNEESPTVAEALEALTSEFPVLRYVVRSTPSSMHSLSVLSDIIPAGRFCLTTVDTISRPEDFRNFIIECETRQNLDGYFAVTPFVDDEKPLWVSVDPGAGRRIIGFHDKACEMPSGAEALVSGGIYCLDTRSAFPILKSCMNQGISRMRNYQRALLEAGLHIEACVFPKIMDIDHAADIEKAEVWLATDSATERLN